MIRLSEDAIEQEEASRSFRAFVGRVKPNYQWYAHCAKLGVVLERVASGEIRRLMIFMPPRHGKSEEVSRLFSAHYLRRFPDRWVGLCSYSADLAFTLSRAARENFVASGGKVKAHAKAVGHWEVEGGGGFWAAGVGGPITGKGFHCLEYDMEIASPLGRLKIGDIVRANIPVPVYSFNHETGRVEVRMAHRFSERQTSEPYVRVVVGRQVLLMTPEHPVYVEGRGYIPASDVRKGDRVLCLRQGAISVTTAAVSIFVSRVCNSMRRGASALVRAIRSIGWRMPQGCSVPNAGSNSESNPRIFGASRTIFVRTPVMAPGSTEKTIPISSISAIVSSAERG